MLLLAVFFLTAAAAAPQTLDALAARLERLERQNAELAEQVRLLRQELQRGRQQPDTPAARLDALEEKVDLHAGRIAEHDQIKVEGTNRTSIRLTGMALFNLFRTSRHYGGTLFVTPIAASNTPGRITSAATMRQSVVGLEFQAPEAIYGGQFRGSVFLDLISGAETTLFTSPRLRTASIEGQWKSRGFLVGQEKPIFSARLPNSLANVDVAPLVGAGNLWLWRPQAWFEQRFSLGSSQQFRARIGISQTSEGSGTIQPQFAAAREPRRPALEGHFQFTHRIDDFRRIEIAHGFHHSTTHVAGLDIPANLFSFDGFANPIRRLEFTGVFWTGKNLSKLGGIGAARGFVISIPRPGELLAVPVRSQGGWAQVSWLATSRLTFNLYGGIHDFNDRDVLPGDPARNRAYAANFFYRLAPNVLSGLEASQVRTRFPGGRNPLLNHYNLYVAYLF